MPFARLRWQLTASHLLAIVITLLSMIACVAFIAASWFGSAPTREPANEARGVAAAIGGMVQNGATSDELNPILRGMADGSLRLAVGFTGPDRRGVPGNAFGFSDVAYIVLLDPSGGVLASSDPSGAAFAPVPSAATGSAPITDRNGRTIATVVVGSSAAQQPEPPSSFDALRGLAIFGAASIAVLLAASVFAIASASIVAFLLSRPLVRRLERLGVAAEALAAGDLTQRVETGDDEVGQLGQRFNAMAADLERSLAEVRAERDRVSGLLDERRQMIASASHELRTPVATIRGYLESTLVRTGELPAGIANDLEIVQREVQRLQQLIEDLFALSQAAVGRLSLRLEPTDTADVVRRLVDTSAPLAWRQRRVQVLFETPSGAVSPARADEQRLEQIVSNLLGNAIRHTPPGGMVAATVCQDASSVVVEVRDTGEGISEEDLPRVFERFFRGRSANGEAGAGLGLALVKELSEAMGGSVEAHSTPGEGSTFVVRLPAS